LREQVCNLLPYVSVWVPWQSNVAGGVANPAQPDKSNVAGGLQTPPSQNNGN